MDNTIIAAFIGAAAALIAPLLSKNYVEIRLRTIEPSKPLDKSTASILRFLSAFSVKSARVIHLKKRRAQIVEELGLVLLLDETWPALGSAWIDFTVFGQPQDRLDVKLGTALSYQYEGKQYYLICTSISEMRQTVEIQIIQRMITS